MRRVFNKTAERASDHLPIDPDLAAPRQPGLRTRFGFLDLSLVGLGGAIGTFARYEAQLRWPDLNGHFPLTIFIVNISGSFLLGVIVSVLVRLNRIGGLGLFSCVGVLGGWTTMSTLAVRVDTSVSAHHFMLAGSYAVTSLFAGALAAGAGVWSAHRLLQERHT